MYYEHKKKIEVRRKRWNCLIVLDLRALTKCKNGAKNWLIFEEPKDVYLPFGDCYFNSVNCDRPGECSPEKDCLR